MNDKKRQCDMERKENTIVIWTGCHAPRDRHQINRCDASLTDSLRRMCARHGWPIRVKEGGVE